MSCIHILNETSREVITSRCEPVFDFYALRVGESAILTFEDQRTPVTG
jgi:hypothetical protein